jgi:hypothetical protein
MTSGSVPDDGPEPGTPSWQLLTPARERAGLSMGELYMRYVALGGSASLAVLRGHCTAGAELSVAEGDLAVLALNERFLELDVAERLSYSR